MIPKIIHFCWLSADPYPKKIAQCLKSWEKHLNGYEIRLWDYNRFPRGKSEWVDQAFDNKKYAFAADYIRAYALYHEGGIYLDSDVELIKNFDTFLHLPYIFGQECDSGLIEAAVMGTEKGNPVFKTLLDYYDTHTFMKKDQTFDILPLPARLNNILKQHGEIAVIDDVKSFSKDKQTVFLFTPDFFSPIHIINMRLEKTHNTVAIHHFAGSWKSPWSQLKKRIQRIIGPSLTNTVQNIKRYIIRRQVY